LSYLNDCYVLSFFGRLNLGRQLNLLLVLEQVQSQVFQRGGRSFEIDNSHALVQDGEDTAHEVIGVR